MALTATLYNITDDPRTLSKNLDGKTIGNARTCNPYNSVDDLRPSLILDYDADALSANYLYIDEWKRYYFITNISPDTGHKMIVSCEEDVLMSFKEDIKKVECVIDRSSWDNKNLYISDSEMILYQFTQSYHHPFDYTFDPFNHIYLSTIG